MNLHEFQVNFQYLPSSRCGFAFNFRFTCSLAIRFQNSTSSGSRKKVSCGSGISTQVTDFYSLIFVCLIISSLCPKHLTEYGLLRRAANSMFPPNRANIRKLPTEKTGTQSSLKTTDLVDFFSIK